VQGKPIELNKLIAMISAFGLVLVCRAVAADAPAPASTPALSATAPPSYQVLISVPDQRLAVVLDGELLERFPVSTSRFGTGDNYGSCKTPLGQLKVCDKIGGNLPPGAVIRHRSATGEVLPVNAPGRDPIVTRVIWLDGLEAQNKNARSRGIYIHGTPEERTIGTPVSWGCIRMRSKDVIRVFDTIPVGTIVSIVPSKLPHLHKYEPPKIEPVPAPETAEPTSAIAAAKSSAPQKPASAPAAAIASAKTSTPEQKPSAASAKPSAIVPPAHESLASLPPIAEGPDHGNASALRLMKGSILLANIPGIEPGKLDDHHKKATQ
jgi:lipoprotein-anchoring transpeptidase ErfK/SrfK